MTRYSTFSAPRGPLRKMSEHRERALDDYDKCRAIVKKRAKGRCEGIPLWAHECQGPKDTHHVLTLKRGGELSDPDNCLYLCRLAHDFAHSNPIEAEKLGLLKSSWSAR